MSVLAASPSTTITGGALPLAMGLAVVAGLVSFASPCVLPLVPGFLAYVTGLSDERRRTRLVLGAVLFVLGFAAVFVGVATAYGLALDLTQAHRDLTTRVSGVIVVVLALVYLGFIGQGGTRVSWRPAAGLATAPLLGVVFGLSMSPCTGPVYGAILSMTNSLNGSTTDRGVILATCFALGMGLPFVLIAAGWSRAEKASRWLRDHHRPIQLIGGTLMLALGLLMVSGYWLNFLAWVQSSVLRLGGFETVL